MAFSEAQQKIIDSHLRLDDLGELDGPKITIELSKREARMLAEALDHFRETRCPMEGKGDECALVFWSESPHSGAAERNCIGRCDAMVEEFLGERTQEAFPPRKR